MPQLYVMLQSSVRRWPGAARVKAAGDVPAYALNSRFVPNGHLMLTALNRVSPLPKAVIAFLEELCAHPKVERLIVFGSRACGDYETFSDLDLAVDAPGLALAGWLAMRDTACNDVKTVIQISLVNFADNPLRLQERILSEGVVIYDKRQKIAGQPGQLQKSG